MKIREHIIPKNK